jgi:hypothetical protein
MCFVGSCFTIVLFGQKMKSSVRLGFVRMAMPFRTVRATNGLRQERLYLDAAALQFGFNRVKDDLGCNTCKASPEDDRSARRLGIRSCKVTLNARCRLARAYYLSVTPNNRRISSPLDAARIADVLRTILYIADIVRWLLRTSVCTNRNLSSDSCRSSTSQSKCHDDAARLGGIAFELDCPLSTHPNWQQPQPISVRRSVTGPLATRLDRLVLATPRLICRVE